MMPNLISIHMLVAAALVPAATSSSGPALFSYDPTASNGPQNWKNLAMEGNKCGGMYNSPIDVPALANCDLKEDYIFTDGDCPLSSMIFSINDHGVKAEFPGDGRCEPNTVEIPRVDGVYKALQFHIHTSTEHTVNRHHFDFEMHIVHQLVPDSGDGSGPDDRVNEYAVVGMMFKKGGLKNEKFDILLNTWKLVYERILNTPSCKALVHVEPDTNETDTHTDTNETDTHTDVEAEMSTEEFAEENDDGHLLRRGLQGYFNVYSLMPTLDFYHYSGGLTTPPCSEVVWWNLNADPISISDAQADLLTELITGYKDDQCHSATVADPVTKSTSRPTQEAFNRDVDLYCPAVHLNRVEGTSDGSFFHYNILLGVVSAALVLASFF